MRLREQVQALSFLLGIACWHWILARVTSRSEVEERATDATVVEHERGWFDYVRGFHAHHDDSVRGDRPEHGSFREGLLVWKAHNYFRGYTRGNDVFICPNAPRTVRVHQVGHAPAFGATFDPLRTERRADGGLEDEPLGTLDVMLPGTFPHTLVRVRDPRGLRQRYDQWLATGRIGRV